MGKDKLILYHGSDHKLSKPLYGFGKQDNDYGSGFYTTTEKDKAEAWGMAMGGGAAYVNCYEIDFSDLNIINLDDYGVLAWIAEIAYNRGVRGENASYLAKEIEKRYKINMGNADIVIGYRADDSYIDIIDAFLENQLNIDEVERLFRKGSLGYQHFIKSERAFQKLKFCGAELVRNKNFVNQSEITARREVYQFLSQRSKQILTDGFQPFGITAREVCRAQYVYNREYNYYAISDDCKIDELSYF